MNSIFESGDLFGKTRLDNNLLSATIELTYKCNLKCSHCFLGKKRYLRKPEALTTKVIYGLLDQLADMGCLLLTFTGGEIFLKRDIFKILRYAMKRSFCVTLFTNGTLIDSDLAKKIRDVHPSDVEISFYSLKKDIFENITGVRGSHERVINAISHLKDNNVRLYLKTPVFKENFSEIKSLGTYAEKIGAGFLCDLHMHAPEDDSFSSLKHRLSDVERKKHIIEFYDRLCKVMPSPKPENGICSSGRSTLTISAFGDIQPCLEWRTRRHNIGKETVRDAWLHGIEFNVARAMKWEDMPKCRECPAIPYCSFCPPKEMKEHKSLSFAYSDSCRWAKLRKQIVDGLARLHKP